MGVGVDRGRTATDDLRRPAESIHGRPSTGDIPAELAALSPGRVSKVGRGEDVKDEDASERYDWVATWARIGSNRGERVVGNWLRAKGVRVGVETKASVAEDKTGVEEGPALFVAIVGVGVDVVGGGAAGVSEEGSPVWLFPMSDRSMRSPPFLACLYAAGFTAEAGAEDNGAKTSFPGEGGTMRGPRRAAFSSEVDGRRASSEAPRLPYPESETTPASRDGRWMSRTRSGECTARSQIYSRRSLVRRKGRP